MAIIVAKTIGGTAMGVLIGWGWMAIDYRMNGFPLMDLDWYWWNALRSFSSIGAIGGSVVGVLWGATTSGVKPHATAPDAPSE